LAGSRRISKPILKIFDKTVWIWSHFDRLLPWDGLSLILVARNDGGAGTSRTECALNQQTPASTN
jgi:hypothetical protein